MDTNRNQQHKNNNNPPTSGRFLLQTTQLPRPQFPERVLESKSAKTLANNNRKILGKLQPDTDSSSKEGSVTEDSGVGSQISSDNNIPNIEVLDTSPTFRFHRYSKPRTLDVVVSGKRFDVRDRDAHGRAADNVAPPRMPTVHPASQSNEMVLQRTVDYQKMVDNKRGCDEVESGHRGIPFIKGNRVSSPFSSDDCAAGEAMADDISCCFSSSDESRDKDAVLVVQKVARGTALQNRPTRHEIKNIFLTIEDSTFAAVAASSNTGDLLEDETSPSGSMACSTSEIEEALRKLSLSSPVKDINQKSSLSPPSPGTPTNVSLSLSEGKDFFVDDEIADQPALVFDDTVTANDNSFGNVQSLSENTATIEYTPKSKRKPISAFKEQPLPARPKRILMQRTGSVDTLSPCESIASDDLMLDFEYSQNSGMDDGSDR